MRFYREGLYHSTMKILTDEAVQNWKADIQVIISIYNLLSSCFSCFKLSEMAGLHD